MIKNNTYYASHNHEILKNISNCINDKLALLDIKLPKLAHEADVDYFTLRKIINLELDYMPNLRILIKLANFLNIKVGDLLNYSDLPQYIPIIKKFEIDSFLANNIEIKGFKNTVLSEKYIHPQAFGFKEINNELIIPAEVIYICYPHENIVLMKDHLYLFKLTNNLIDNVILGRIKSMDEKLRIAVGQQIISIDSYHTIAIVVNIQMNERLI